MHEAIYFCSEGYSNVQSCTARSYDYNNYVWVIQLAKVRVCMHLTT